MPRVCPEGCLLIKGGVQGRTDHITKVKGVLLSPAAIEEVVRNVQGLGDEYEVIVDKVGEIDRITLKVELLDSSQDRLKAIESQLENPGTICQRYHRVRFKTS
jgi:phenylacetate-CoA ligase